MKFVYEKINTIRRNPYLFFIIGFSFIILTGALLLSLPFATNSGRSAGFINALFTSASSICVTGLVVVNTAEYWSVFGKIVILLLIQMGGLGVMTMSTMISLFFGRRISLKTRVLIMEERNVDELQGVVRLTKNILIYTFGLELVGAILFSTVFIGDYGIVKGIAFSLFHSISSFCNAGFDLFGNSLMNYTDNFIVNFIVWMLVVIGGLGYFVVWDIYVCRCFKRLTLHSKLVLVITGILLLFGTVIIFIFEYNNAGTIGNLNIFGKIQASIFHSISPRTAGFNSISIKNLRIPTVTVIIMLMFIGGSPASTSGGIKTTTLGVICISIYNLVKGKRDIEIYQRRILPETAVKSMAVAGLSLIIINVATVILTVTESGSGFQYLDILFEAVSAFGTVGLSRGLTPSLSNFGKILISLLMLTGKVGPLTMAYGLMRQKKNIGNYTFPEGKIIIG